MHTTVRQEKMARNRIETILLILVFLTPLVFTFRLTNYNIPKTAIIEVFAFFTLAMWLVRNSLTGRFRTINSPLNLPVLTLLGWQIVSALWATNKFETLEVVFLHIALITLYFMALNNVRKPEHFLIVMVITGGLVSIYGILQYLGIDFADPKPIRLVSTLGNINFAGEYLVMIIPLGIAMVFHSKGKHLKMVSGVSSMLMLAHLLMTKSRGAWIGLAGGGMILFFMNPFIKERLRAVMYISLIIIVAFSVICLVSQNREISSIGKEAISILDMRQSGALFRFLVWKSALRMIGGGPVQGIGAGNFGIVYPLYRSPEEWHISGIDVRVEKAHNDYLQIASELGLVGLGIFIWLLATAFRTLKELIKTRSSVLITGLLASIVSMSISAVFGFPFHTPATSLTFWMILGIAGALQPDKMSEREFPRSRTGVLLFGTVLLAGLAAVHIAQVVAGDFHLQRARISQKRKAWDRTISNCEKSVDVYYPNIQAHVYLARAFQKKGQLENAFVELKTILRLHPNHPWAHMCLGNIYLKLKKPEEAISSLETAAKLNPSYLNNLGIAYLEKNMLDEALSTFEKTVAMGWDNELTHTYLGMIYDKKGK